MAEASDVRIDKWLWAARVFKTRGLALEACKAGHVKILDQPVKPARPVHVGEILIVRTAAAHTRTLRVVGVSDKRVGPKLVPTLLDDLTPPEELERIRLSFAQQVLARPKGSGRPTKRDRRQLDDLVAPEGF
ncbi:RNA-binding S4 domain-containing protein [Opitutales bacterium ASA1]|uniref:RNA-binding S4 domain-containing protein n=1 Tax=Congregicoccus parvus TaxID=3081749 RepID=UPI002B2BDE3D|nr:RNA-binding S4 domain-containing protein [Opitutales bacterium ASA1]